MDHYIEPMAMIDLLFLVIAKDLIKIPVEMSNDNNYAKEDACFYC